MNAETVFRDEVVVDCTIYLQDMIRKIRFGYVCQDILYNRYFPVVGEGRQKAAIELLRFDCEVGANDAIKWMEEHKLRPARIEELLALLAAYPDLWRQFPKIVALGSQHLDYAYHGIYSAVGVWLHSGGKGYGLATVQLFNYFENWYCFACVRA